jgi:hypothetical protein
MTWRELDLHVRGYFLRLARQKWMMREVIWNMWATVTPGDKFNLERKGLMILPWDEEDPPRREFTTEELEEISARFDKVAK